MKDLPTSLYECCIAHARADRSVRMFIAQSLERYDVTLMEWLMLSIVCAAPAEGHSMTAVARELDVTLPQVTSLANKLLDLRLIEQKIQAHDRRARHVHATAHGKKTLQQIEKSLTYDFANWIYDDVRLTPDDLQQYIATSKRLARER